MSTTPVTSMPVWQARDLSFGAKMTFLAWQAGIPVPDDAWRSYLAKMGQSFVPKEVCLAELKASGWMA
ncbi:hypothetical protein AB0945_18880 [Streptomyces sp. NPDC005474]|uniref:hypothetical protein n=1 Tax=Streptomyces sp. NPDC005474 TaxID=3154878 RepID=UPI003455D47B